MFTARVRRVAVAVSAAAAAVALTPTGANAAPIENCVPIPANTSGLTVQYGDTRVHVPALSNARLCTIVDFRDMYQPPASFETFAGCGVPCFRLVVEGGAVHTWARAAAVVRYTADGVPAETWLFDRTIPLTAYNEQLCISAGNQTPECPEGSLALLLTTV